MFRGGGRDDIEIYILLNYRAEVEAQIQAFLASLTPEQQAALEAEALAGADPAAHAAYEAATAP